MGCCSSCIRVILDSEPDVKINVIEPTSIGVGGAEHSVSQVTRTPEIQGPTLQVPSFTNKRRESAA